MEFKFIQSFIARKGRLMVAPPLDTAWMSGNVASHLVISMVFLEGIMPIILWLLRSTMTVPSENP